MSKRGYWRAAYRSYDISWLYGTWLCWKIAVLLFTVWEWVLTFFSSHNVFLCGFWVFVVTAIAYSYNWWDTHISTVIYAVLTDSTLVILVFNPVDSKQLLCMLWIKGVKNLSRSVNNRCGLGVIHSWNYAVNIVDDKYIYCICGKIWPGKKLVNTWAIWTTWRVKYYSEWMSCMYSYSWL